MNALSHTIRKFNRFELKYIITLEQAARFRQALRAFLVPDEHGNNNGRYSLSSLYYDSPDLRCYREKENGIKFRRKLRIRHYQDGILFTDETPVFVEIKQRVDRVTQKRRALLPYRDALRLCNLREIPEHDEADRKVIEEIYAFLWAYNLRPASMITYDRQALVGTTYDAGLRVTFDTALTYHIPPFQLHEKRAGLLMIPANKVVMEIKVNERIPTWLVNLIAEHNLPLQRISKYCTSIEASWENPLFLRRGTLTESPIETLSTTHSVFNQDKSKIKVIRRPKSGE